VQNCFHDYIHVSMMIDEESKSLSSPSGIGMGLYVAYNIVESLGGMLQCSSTDDTATFSFTLFLRSAPKEEIELLVRDGSAVFAIEDSKKPLAKTTMRVDSFDWDNISDETKVLPGFSNFDSFSSDIAFETERKENTPRRDELVCPDIQRSKFKSLKLHPRVLVVDDSSLNQKILTVALKSLDCTWDVAHNGMHAFDLLQREPCIFDMVLMDLRMPIMDGIVATKKCRQLFHLKHVPIIMMSAESGPHIVEDSLNAGANQYIRKPISKDVLRELFETWFHHRS
jgi:CheY-like chemotaxis protein